MKKLAIITTHPIQYYAPIFKLMADSGLLQIKVFYTLGNSSFQQIDPGFDRKISWDIPLLAGYDFQFEKNTSRKPNSSTFWGIKTPHLIKNISNWQADAVLIFGWSYHSHLKAMYYFKGKIPVFFRGDSTLINKKKGVKNSIKRAILTKVYQYIDHAFFVGTNNKAYFKYLGLKEKQLTFTPHAIDNERFKTIKKDEVKVIKNNLQLRSADLLILYAGKFEAVKSVENLLSAFDEIDQPDLHLLCVGNGPLETTLKAQKVSLKTASRIHFLGFQNQSVMPSIYQACDIFCLPSTSESWGLAVNEAMACGKAILASSHVGCAVDLVENGKNGYVFKAGNIKDLSQKLALICADKQILKEFSTSSTQKIENWTFNLTASAIIKAVLNYV